MLPIIIGLIHSWRLLPVPKSAPSFRRGTSTTSSFSPTPFILLGMAEIWLLLLGDIDLRRLGDRRRRRHRRHPPRHSSTTGRGGLALPLAVYRHDGHRGPSGLVTIVLKVPSFIVTLGGSLDLWEGVAIYLIDANNAGGSIRRHGGVLYDIVNVNMSPAADVDLQSRGRGAHVVLRLQQGPKSTRERARQCPVVRDALESRRALGVCDRARRSSSTRTAERSTRRSRACPTPCRWSPW